MQQALKTQQRDISRQSEITHEGLQHLNNKMVAAQRGDTGDSETPPADLTNLQEAVSLVAHVTHAVALNQLNMPHAHIQAPPLDAVAHSLSRLASFSQQPAVVESHCQDGAASNLSQTPRAANPPHAVLGIVHENLTMNAASPHLAVPSTPRNCTSRPEVGHRCLETS